MQWDVAREFRRRVKNEFDRRGIEFPYPQRTINIRDLGNASKNLPD